MYLQGHGTSHPAYIEVAYCCLQEIVQSTVLEQNGIGFTSQPLRMEGKKFLSKMKTLQTHTHTQE